MLSFVTYFGGQGQGGKMEWHCRIPGFSCLHVIEKETFFFSFHMLQSV